MSLFPVKHATVISGAGGSHAPISGIHPHPIEEQKARLLQDALGAIVTGADLGAEARPADDDDLAAEEPAAEAPPSPTPYRIRPK